MKRGDDLNSRKRTYDSTIQQTEYPKPITKLSYNEPPKWWHNVFTKYPNLADVSNSGKIALILEIISHADIIGDKVVVFSQSLYTLDFIEYILNTPKWEDSLPSLSKLQPGKTFGPLKKNSEYLRIDGSTSTQERGELITSFNNYNDNSNNEKDVCANTNNIKLFMISTAAGGVGTNLSAANWVIIFDSHYNPAIDMQTLYRCYKYGQNKPVYTYRRCGD